jgi:3-phenylpropionate/trans-cinnamate dioxygenase ferredoxin reductase subunit
MSASEVIVIIGGGLAAYHTAVSVCDNTALSVIVLSEESTNPYDRPPLSKGMLKDRDEPVWLDLNNRLTDSRIDWRLNCRAISLDRDDQIVKTESESVRYDYLVFATGSRPRSFSGVKDDSRIISIRTLSDVERIKHCLDLVSGRPSVALIGAGFIGLEAASSLSKSCDVAVFESQNSLLSRVMPVNLSEQLLDLHKSNGVTLHLGSNNVSIDPKESSVNVSWGDTSRGVFDFVIMGIGVLPNSELALDSGLQVDNGIVVDDVLRTSDPRVFAVGDCCRYRSTLYQTHVRVESWRSAVRQGEFVGKFLAGISDQFLDVPWFWSDQYDSSIQMSGLPGFGSRFVERVDGEVVMAFELNDADQVTSVCGLAPGNGVAKHIKLSEMLIEERLVVDPSLLADAKVNLKQILKDSRSEASV